MLALLHTSPVHVSTFDRLRDEEAPGLELHHVVDERLLAQARREGPAAAESVLVEVGNAGASGCSPRCPAPSPQPWS